MRFLRMIRLTFSIVIFSIIISSCEKFVSVKTPPNSASSESVFSSDAGATSAILSIYSRLVGGSNQSYATGSISFSVLLGIASDELINYATNTARSEFYNNALQSSNPVNNTLWSKIYRSVYDTNTIIKNLSEPNGLSEGVRNQVLGEARFIRAFCYFYLTELYGDVPLILSPDYESNRQAKNSFRSAIYSQIIGDLLEAKDLLGEDYVDAFNKVTEERTRPNKFAAAAFLSRVYLFAGKYDLAEIEASRVIGSGTRYQLVSLPGVFLRNSQEALWQLSPVVQPYTFEADLGILADRPSTSSLGRNTSLQLSLVNSFAPGDKRRDEWIGSIEASGDTYYYPYKYKDNQSAPGTTPVEYTMVLRMGEQFLIRAEARARMGNLSGALEDLNSVRVRSQLDDLESTDQHLVLQSIFDERRYELFSEWGHRWLDLKRFEKSTEVLAPIKGSTWQPTDILFPIPQRELSTNPNLNQNEGY